MTSKRNITLLAMALMLAPIYALAATIHTSTEDFFANGATRVGNCTGSGCGPTLFGPDPGTAAPLWEVKEVVTTDTTLDTTTFTYTVFNDNFTSEIDSFKVFASSLVPTAHSEPLAAWTFDPTLPGGYWSWSTDVPGTGIAPHSLLGQIFSQSFSATLRGTSFGVTFSPTAVDLTTAHTAQTGANWEASSPMAMAPIPEPEIYAMMGIGLALMGFVARRRKGQDAAA